MELRFGPARPEDAAELAPLVLDSGQDEFAYLLQGTADDRLAFLAHALGRGQGRFSWRRHLVARTVTPQGERIAAVMAVHPGNHALMDDLAFLPLVLRHAGWHAPALVVRGLALASALPAPGKDQVLVAHCATRPDLRGQGVFSRLFQYAREQDLLPDRAQVMLDVRCANPRAAALYRKLGFIELEPARQPRPTPRLPAELASRRLILGL